MKRNNLLLIATAAVFFTVLAGCKKPVTVTNYGTPVVVNSLSNLTAISGNTYANVRSFNLYGWGLLVGPYAVGEHAADEAGFMDQIDNPGTMAYNHPSAGDQYIIDTWNGLFTGVGCANSALSAANIYATQFAPASDSQAIRYIRGESYFLRAWYNFQLECFFGQKYIDMKQPASADNTILGVPLNLSTPTGLADAIQPRATAREVWTSIINDLKTAATLCPASWGTGTEQQRATKWAAEGLLGKAYVFTQQWDSAEKYLGDVITNSGKSLMPFSDYTQAFNDQVPSRGNVLTNYGPQKRFNQESLFEIYVSRTPSSTGYGVFGSVPNPYLGTSGGLFWAPTNFNDVGAPETMSGRANVFMDDQNLKRFGFTIPLDSIITTALVPNQSYPDPNVAEGLSMPGAWYIATSKAFRTNKTDDPRLYVCALEPYMDTVYSASISSSYATSDRKLRLVAPYQGKQTDHFAWSLKKYQTLDANMGEPDITNLDGADYYILRMADIYLLEAEALINDPSGSFAGSTSALEYINTVHRRAYGYAPTLGSSSPVDYLSLTDPTLADPTDVNLYNNPLAYERHAEFFAEGNWWFDIGRWGNSTNSASGNQSPASANGLYRTNFGNNEAIYYGLLYPFYQYSRWNPANPSSDIPATYCYPIPITELNANAKMRAQARGGQNFPF